MLGKFRSEKSASETEEKLAEMKAKAATRIAAMANARSGLSVSTLKEFNTRAGDRMPGPIDAALHLDDTTAIACKVLDYSATGLRLSIPRGAYLPRITIVRCDALGGFMIAEICWQNGVEAGVAIDKKLTRQTRLALGSSAA